MINPPEVYGSDSSLARTRRLRRRRQIAHPLQHVDLIKEETSVSWRPFRVYKPSSELLVNLADYPRGAHSLLLKSDFRPTPAEDTRPCTSK